MSKDTQQLSAWRCKKCGLWASDRYFPSNLGDNASCDGRLIGPDPIGGKPGTYVEPCWHGIDPRLCGEWPCYVEELDNAC